jgi:hypothetical protein
MRSEDRRAERSRKKIPASYVTTVISPLLLLSLSCEISGVGLARDFHRSNPGSRCGTISLHGPFRTRVCKTWFLSDAMHLRGGLTLKELRALEEKVGWQEATRIAEEEDAKESR